MAKQTFTTGQVLTAAQMTSLQQTAMGGGSPSTKTASYVLVAADAGTVIQMNSASSTTITVNTALFSAGDSVQIQNIGAGVCTITAGTATVNTAGSLALSQWEGGFLYFTSASSAIFFDVVQSGGMTNPMTTAGDTIYGGASGTPTRLAIGSTGNVLTVSGGNPVWAAPAGGGALTKITSASFTAQSSVAIDDVFTSTYKMYYVTWFSTASVSGADLELQFRYAGPTTQTTTYYTSGFGYKRDNTLITYGGVNATVGVLYPDLGTGAGGESTGDITFANVGNASENPLYFGKGYGQLSQAAISYAGYNDTQRTYTGFLLKPTSGTITGYYRVYGLAN